MTDFNATTTSETDGEVTNPEGEAPPSVPEASGGEGGQAEAEGTPTEVEYLDIDENADRMVRIKVDGEDVEVPFKEAIQGYQRQSDYTRKTQELATERQQVEQLRVLANALENNPRETLAFLQKQFGVDAAQGMVDAAEAQQGQDNGAVDDPVQRRLDEFEPRLQEFERFQAQQKLDATLSGLQAKYGDEFNAEEVLTRAVEQGVRRAEDLESVYKQVAFDRLFATHQAQSEVAAKAATEKAEREAAKGELNNTVETGPSASGSGTAPPPTRYSTVADAWEAAKAELGL